VQLSVLPGIAENLSIKLYKLPLYKILPLPSVEGSNAAHEYDLKQVGTLVLPALIL
jgi:hypothetical protein